LAGESSPYLLQHADNPVDWYPWGEEAFKRAAEEGKPVFLSIGYSACHWCHVMAHESFEDQDIADYLNENYISIKVDREERPDIDNVYMESVQMMTGRGGWPLSVFLTPKGLPYYGGTYFPPQARGGLTGFLDILRAMKHSYEKNRGDIEQVTHELQSVLSKNPQALQNREAVKAGLLQVAFENIQTEIDPVKGGLGSSPKFPEPLAMEFLLRIHARQADAEALVSVNRTLDAMAYGGIFDHIGGGFHRYSTDNVWRVPHFEKMLYDNALLASLYLHAYQVNRNPLYRDIACRTLDFLLREMRSPEGGFYGTLDADSEGMEGKYYLWSKDEIIDALGKEDGETIAGYYGATRAGNFEGLNILYVADRKLRPEDDLLKRSGEALGKLRNKRVRPGRDEKILASWNGLALCAFSEAAAAFRREDYLDAARQCGTFIAGSLIRGGQLFHTYKEGRAMVPAYLDDYSMLILGLLDLHAASFSLQWLDLAVKLADAMTGKFKDESGALFYDAAYDSEQLFIRPRNLIDGAQPSGNSAAVLALLKLAAITGREEFHKKAEGALQAMQYQISKYPRGFSGWLCALDFYLSAPLEIAIIGRRGDEKTDEMLQAVYSEFLPARVVAAAEPEAADAAGNIALLQGRHAVGGEPAVYICRNYTCSAPVTEIEELVSALKKTASI